MLDRTSSDEDGEMKMDMIDGIDESTNILNQSIIINHNQS